MPRDLCYYHVEAAKAMCSSENEDTHHIILQADVISASVNRLKAPVGEIYFDLTHWEVQFFVIIFFLIFFFCFLNLQSLYQGQLPPDLPGMCDAQRLSDIRLVIVESLL